MILGFLLEQWFKFYFLVSVVLKGKPEKILIEWNWDVIDSLFLVNYVKLLRAMGVRLEGGWSMSKVSISVKSQNLAELSKLCIAIN